MEEHIFNKNYFGRSYTFIQVNTEQKFDINYIRNNSIDGIVITTDDRNKKIHDIKMISNFKELRGLNLNSYCYGRLTDLSDFKKLEYLNFLGKTDSEIPFSSLESLWCVYLNYDKKSCKSVFDCKNLEYIFIDNYTSTSSKDFQKFEKAKRIGLIKSKVEEFNAIKNMPQLEHIGIGYNLKMESIKWLEDNNSLISVALQNCKNIKDWEKIGSLKKIEKLIIENCGELPTLSFLQRLTNIKEIRIIGTTSVKDGKIKEIMKIPQLNYLFIPVKKGYDITIQDLTTFNNKL
ncbi:hypothetical protein [Gilliamella intestini]|uniref:Uncharacterized protein n=1 Tax=Gilliamella intestini TaxID=1798183 RepID=A0A1C4API2_9GAMM|nr:hypothetical protein [Gilliamella intestini]SCB96580.1 hypothetical protein GA0061080_10134 [Gilliamella intestini]